MLSLINRKPTINNNTVVTRSPIYFPLKYPTSHRVALYLLEMVIRKYQKK